MRFHVLTRALTAAAAALALTACGASSEPAAGSQQAGQQHNQADVTFLQHMIPHHEQAIVMSQLVPERAESEQVRELARDIAAAQGPEIEAMKAMLADFGAGMMEGMDHGSMSGMQGMMSPEQMQQLKQLSGPAFDRMFLQMMIEHHQGAIVMSETVLAEGQHPEVAELARQIIEVQQAEIATMTAMLEQG